MDEEKQNKTSINLPTFKEVAITSRIIQNPIISYEESLEIAKKVFQNTQMENYKSIIFTE